MAMHTVISLYLLIGVVFTFFLWFVLAKLRGFRGISHLMLDIYNEKQKEDPAPENVAVPIMVIAVIVYCLLWPFVLFMTVVWLVSLAWSRVQLALAVWKAQRLVKKKLGMSLGDMIKKHSDDLVTRGKTDAQKKEEQKGGAP